MKKYSFEINFDGRKLVFSSEAAGLMLDGKEYLAKADGVLIYDKTKGLKTNSVVCQLSTNTSTLIPALRVLGLPYNPYFDKHEVINSQNDITFYWKPSRLAAFYNRFSTDLINLERREPIIRKAVKFLIDSAEKGENFLPREILKRTQEKCKLLGFYQGFPVFDGRCGFAKLNCRLGIHIDPDGIMISTPLDKYAQDVEEVTSLIEKQTGLKAIHKKNRTRFEKYPKLMKLLGLEKI